MKLQIDTTLKYIRVEHSIKISELIKEIKKLLPNDWQEYSLEAVTTIYNWQYPIIWQNPINVPFTYTDKQVQPFEITCGNAETIFNIETN